MVLCLGTLLAAFLKIISHGFFPADDAFRHVAKVISGKDWSDILVIRPEITMDSHPGWHAILGWVQGLAGADGASLLNFSVLFLFLTFALPAVFYFRRQEAWVASLAVSTLFFFSPVFRLFYGRPFIVSMILILLFCFLWERIRDRDKPWLELIAFTLATALATWIHGTWYLFSLPLFALALARQWRVFVLMSAATVAGIVLGALFTGTPVAFLHQMLFHAVEAFGKHDFQRQLVTEFQPFSGEVSVFVIVGGLLLWRWARGQWDARIVDNPVFYLLAVGWTMGFLASRFWSDWAWPALAFWMAREIQDVLEYYSETFSLKRLVLACTICLVFFLALSNDRGSRWSGVVSQWPEMTNEEHRPWLPEEGGVLYNDDMRLFFQVFFHNPHGPWRYTLGFEPVWMPREHLEIFRHIQLTRGKAESYQPWVEMMTDRDRMVLVRNGRPDIQGLEWHEVTPGVWSGRLPGRPDAPEERQAG